MSDAIDPTKGSQQASMATPETPPTLPPSAALLQMMTGYWMSKAIYVTARLGVADHLASGPRSAEELAVATQAHAPALYRVLRALASIGIRSEVVPGRFALTPMASLLRSGTPDSMRALAIMYGEDQYRAWDDALYSVQTGRPAFDHAFGATYFDYFATHPEASRIFNEAMVGWTTQLTDAVVAAYDFSSFGVVADVGGGHGALLAAILKSSPATLGILFDLPQVVESAEPFLTAAGVAGRCTRVGGDFFAAMPTGADAYVLAQILHDWDDERSLAILRQIRQVIPDQGRLLIVELVLPEGNEPFLGKWLDLHMLVLLHAASFELAEVVSTSEPQSIIEARPV